MSYFISKSVIEILPTILFSQGFAIFAYYWSGQPLQMDRFKVYLLIVFLSFLCTEGFGHNIAIMLSSHMQLALCASIALFAVMAMFEGFFIKIQDMPLPLQWASNWAFAKFVFQVYSNVYENNVHNEHELA